MRLTAITCPWQPEADHPDAISPREIDAVDEFSAALGKAAGVSVDVIEGSLADAPPDGFIIAFSAEGLAEHPTLGPRVVLVNADRASVLEQLEQHSLVAAVEKHRYFLWRRQRAQERGRGLFGRKDVAARIGATFDQSPFVSARYAYLASEGATNLPELMAQYLSAYEPMQVATPTLPAGT